MNNALYETLGKDETVYLHAWTSDKAASVDNTHTNVWGARVNACLCLNEVKNQQVAGLSEHILDTDEKEVLDRSKYLVPILNITRLYLPRIYQRAVSGKMRQAFRVRYSAMCLKKYPKSILC